MRGRNDTLNFSSLHIPAFISEVFSIYSNGVVTAMSPCCAACAVMPWIISSSWRRRVTARPGPTCCSSSSPKCWRSAMNGWVLLSNSLHSHCSFMSSRLLQSCNRVCVCVCSVQGPRLPLLPAAVWHHAVRPDPRAESRPEEVLPAHRARVPHRSHSGTAARGLELCLVLLLSARPTGLRSWSNLSPNAAHSRRPKRMRPEASRRASWWYF